MTRHLINITSNFLAVLALVALIAAPIYFATKFARVSGVKSESSYLIISQVDKFPGMSFSQLDTNYSLSYTQQAQKQAYLSTLVINNPTDETKSYTIVNDSPQSKMFFGEDLNQMYEQISLPPGASMPMSLISEGEELTRFEINVNY